MIFKEIEDAKQEVWAVVKVSVTEDGAWGSCKVGEVHGNLSLETDHWGHL